MFTLQREFHLEADMIRGLEFRSEEIADGDFKVDSNLATFGFDDNKQHSMIERCLLGLGGLNQRVEEMKTHNAISGFLDPECPLFSDRLGFSSSIGLTPSAVREFFEGGRNRRTSEVHSFLGSDQCSTSS